MKTHVIYIYENTSTILNAEICDTNYCKSLKLQPLVALDNNMHTSTPSRQDTISGMGLKPIEIWQDNFLLFIKKIETLGVDLTSIEFTDDVDFELWNDLKEALINKNYKKTFRLVKIIKNDNVDISSLTLIHKTNRYRITKNALVEVSGEDFSDALNKIEESPLLFILGLLQFPD